MARQEIDLTTPQPNGKMGEPTKSAWEKVNDMTLDLYNGLSSSYGVIRGMTIERAADKSVRITSGAAHIESSNSFLSSQSSSTKAFSFSGPSWAYVYTFAGAGGVADFEVSQVAPAAPYFGNARSKAGDSSRRFIGPLFINAAGNIVPFAMARNLITYLNSWAPANRFLSNGQQTSNTTVGAAVYVPPISRLVKLYVQNTSTSSSVNLRAYDDAAGSYSQIVSIDPAPSSGLTSAQVIDFYLSSNREMQYMHSATPNGGAFLNIAGYYFDR